MQRTMSHTHARGLVYLAAALFMVATFTSADAGRVRHNAPIIDDAPMQLSRCANDGETCRCSSHVSTVRACLQVVPSDGRKICDKRLCGTAAACDCEGRDMCTFEPDVTQLRCNAGARRMPCACHVATRDTPAFHLIPIRPYTPHANRPTVCSWPSYFWA